MKEAFLLILLLATQVFAEDPLSALLGAKASFRWLRYNSLRLMGLIRRL